MPRPRHCRRVAHLPQVTFYKPQGVPLSILQHIALTADELEAIRLADLQGLYQEHAAEKIPPHCRIRPIVFSMVMVAQADMAEASAEDDNIIIQIR